MKRSIILIFLILTAAVAIAQPKEELVGELERLLNVNDLLPQHIDINGTTQGFAIYGRYAFSMHDKGQCVIIDLKKKSLVNTFILDGNTGHCNNASFGVERYSRKSQFPLLYVTECRGERACYVNDITTEGARLVQKIFYDGEEITGPCDWAVDAARKRIYLYCTIGSLRWLKWFPLPRLSDSDSNQEVHLQPTDALGSIPAGDIAIPQGSHIYKDVIFLPDGVPSRGVLRLHASNVVSGKKLMNLDLSDIGLEPEGVATHRGYLYISFHTPRKNRDNVIYRTKITRRN